VDRGVSIVRWGWAGRGLDGRSRYLLVVCRRGLVSIGFTQVDGLGMLTVAAVLAPGRCRSRPTPTWPRPGP
jgi:hypothetical protein